ncbi:glycosyltransferase family 4 protein [candidate division WWE3 bacterium]|uniref:Glycosyltransferase family 4 protein n=1 Tax=candidate division WWE3 bacterium TaxID=2053526 RepID=A0A7X9E7B9_UNCKA|nr:glycosyltransferase family 4 protein [candidate division WWE3 bacterium]
MKQPKVALAHEFLEQYGGAEKTFEEIAKIFPNSPVYTAKYNPKYMTEFIKSREIIYPKGLFNGLSSKLFFLFKMPTIFESFDYRKYDIVVSDGNTWNKGIITKPEQLHITYIHTPPRFLYKYSQETTKWEKPTLKPMYSYLSNALRIWDYVAAQRPDYILTNSENTRKRIKKFYGRDSKIIYPPVDVNVKSGSDLKKAVTPYFVAVGRLSRYKNFDLLIDTFNEIRFPLVIVGTGKEESKLKAKAKENIIFKGRASDEEKHQILENSVGLINPVVEEDFGIVPVEAMAHGKPVLAHRSGGHLETIVEGEDGMFFEEETVECLSQKLIEFDKAIKNRQFNHEKIKEHAQRFSRERFSNEFENFVREKWEEHQKNA